MSHFVTFAAIAAMAFSAFAGEGLVLLKAGRPCVRVDALSHGAAVVTAADELCAYMRALSGRSDYTGGQGGVRLSLAIAGDGSSHVADEMMASHRLGPDSLGEEGFLLDATGPGAYVLTAYSGKGVLNGVYRMFERAFGVVAPRPLVGLEFPERFDEAQPIAVPFVSKPAFSVRGVQPSYFVRCRPDLVTMAWAARVGLVTWTSAVGDYLDASWAKDVYGMTGVAVGHSLYGLVSPREHFKTHPEYFSLVDGKRQACDAQVTVGNPAVVDLIVKGLLEMKRRRPELTVVPFGCNDCVSKSKGNRFGWGEDPLDTALDSPADMPQPGSDRPRSYSTRYIKTANKVVARLNEVHPDLKLMVYAYHYEMIRPPDCDVHPNLVVEFAPLYKCCHHSMGDAECPRNRFFDECLRGWTAKTKNVYMRDYFLGGAVGNRHFPLMTLGTLKADAQYFRKLGLLGMAPETLADGPNGANVGGCTSIFGCSRLDDACYTDYWDANALLHFALARFLWNPDESVEEVVRLYCNSYYGQKTGAIMSRYFMSAEQALAKSSHVGERNAVPLTSDLINTGKWCFCWCWNNRMSDYAKSLFCSDDGGDVEKTALPMLEILFQARQAASSCGRAVRNRVETDFELMKAYLASVGYELNAASMKKPALTAIGSK